MEIDIALWLEQGDDPAVWWARFCYECGACVAQCTAARFGTGFDPRDIVLKARYGLTDKLLAEESVLWQCFKCHNCCNCCPMAVKPADVVAALRAMLEESVRTGQPESARLNP